MSRILLLLLVACATLAHAAPPKAVVIGSKAFTESVILGEMAVALVESTNTPAEHRRELGGTRVLWSALLAGEIDAYPEYSGTLLEEIYADRSLPDKAALFAALAADGVRMSAPLGFQNTYALGLNPALADRLDLRQISDLRNHPTLRFAFGNEFMDRGDGWPGLRAHYALPHTDVRGMSHDLAYRALQSEAVDLIDLYSTDAEIAYYELRTLTDDRQYFPKYEALWLYRADMDQTAVTALQRLQGQIDATTMSSLNAKVKLEGVDDTAVAVDYVNQRLGLNATAEVESALQRLIRNTLEHLTLVLVSLLAAIAVALPLGIWAAKSATAGKLILAIVSVVQTIPSLALFVFMIPLLGIGAAPAIAALFLYSLLPIVRNTYTGLTDIPVGLRESAVVMGLPPAARLWSIELPLSLRSILAGIKTAAVINVGTATLAALIGAGGYGQPILTGIRLDDLDLILQGAVPAAAMALLVQGSFELGERVFLPRSLRT